MRKMIQINLLSSVEYDPKEPVEQWGKLPKKIWCAVWKMAKKNLFSSLENDTN